MNRIARGMVSFTSKRVLRLFGVPKEVLPPVEVPKDIRKKVMDVSAKPLAIATAAGALIYVTADDKIKDGVKRYVRNVRKTYRRMEAEGSRARTGTKTGSSSRPNARPRTSTKASRNGSTNGAPKEMTRQELYELAKKKNVPGRSHMTKAELEKAVR